MKHCPYHLVIELAEKYLPFRFMCIRCGELLEQARRKHDIPVDSGNDLGAIIKSGGFAQ